MGGLHFSRDGKLLSLSISGSAAPSDIWVMNVATKKLSEVTHVPHAGVDLSQMERPQLVKFKAHDGLELSAWCTGGVHPVSGRGTRMAQDCEPGDLLSKDDGVLLEVHEELVLRGDCVTDLQPLLCLFPVRGIDLGRRPLPLPSSSEYLLGRLRTVCIRQRPP